MSITFKKLLSDCLSIDCAFTDNLRVKINASTLYSNARFSRQVKNLVVIQLLYNINTILKFNLCFCLDSDYFGKVT